MGLTIKPKEMVKFLESKGYKFVRARGSSHHIYSDGKHTVSVPIHGGREFDESLIKKILKEAKIQKSSLLRYLNR